MIGRAAGLALALALSAGLGNEAAAQPVYVDGELVRETGSLIAFFPYLEAYEALPATQRDRFRPVYRVSVHGAPPPPDMRLWYVLDGRRHALAMRPDGALERPPDAHLDADPALFTNQPRSGMALALVFEPMLKPARTLLVEALVGALVQANAGRRAVLGVAGMLTPDMDTIVLEFEGPAPARAEIVFANGRREPLLIREDRAFFRPGDRAMRGADRLELGAAPVLIRLED